MSKSLNIISFFTILGILTWIWTDFHGGMTIYLFMYPWLVILVVLGYVITLIITVSQIIRNGIGINKIGLSIHSIELIVASSLFIFNSELFKSESLLEAILIDDLNTITIKLRSNNTFDTTVQGMFGFVERISGEYHLEQDTIVFHQPPYMNDFIPNKIIIDESDSALYFNQLANGQFDRTKSFVNYFEIYKNKL